MGQKIPSIEFLGEDDPERAKKCRLMAAEASSLAAAAATPETRAAYLDLKRQWEALAEEMERATVTVPIEKPSTGETAN